MLMAPTGGFPSRPTFQLVTVSRPAGDPLVRLTDPSAAANTGNTLLRVPGGGFTLASATDAAPTTAVTNALVLSRSGSAWSSLTFGNATNNPTYTFAGSGASTFGGTVLGTGALFITGSNTGVANTSYTEFRDSTGTQVGYVGDGQSGNNDIRLVNTVSAGAIELTTTGGGAVNINGVPITASSTTATGTVTGCTTAPTTTVRYVKIGNLVTGSIDTVACTSNAITFSLTGAVPAAMQPTRLQQSCTISATDNAANFTGACAQFSSGSTTMTIVKVPGNFTAAGVKGLNDGTTFAYITN